MIVNFGKVFFGGLAILFIVFAVWSRATRDPDEDRKLLHEAATGDFGGRLPVQGWEVGRPEVLALKPGQTISWNFKVREQSRKIKVEVNAVAPVSFTWDGAECREGQEHPGVFETTTECTIAPRAASQFKLTDDRGGMTVAETAVAVYTKNNASIERATAPNRVRIVFKMWTCIKNCT